MKHLRTPAANRAKCIHALPVISVLYPTGTMARRKNSTIEKRLKLNQALKKETNATPKS